MNLSVKIAGSGYEDLYPYELVLEEGFSRIYRAELTVLTTTLRVHKDLKELLDQKISLHIVQRIAGGLITRSRWLHGIITGTASRGVVNRGEGANCYRSVFTIESELARLRHTHLSHPYYRKTPPDIIEEILAKYHIQGQFSDRYVNRSSFGKNLMFDQENLSDLDFIHSLMGLYGMTWTFVHGQAPGLGTAELHFTEGERFPQPFYEYSDKRKIPEIEKFDFVNYDEGKNFWKMDSWGMESGIGVEGMEINALYPEANHGSREWRWGDTAPGKRYYMYNSLFHGYERHTETAEIDKDMERIIQARRLSLGQEKENWRGGAENILLMPGLLFELGHFYGHKDTSPVNALVTAAKLRVRTLWPRDIAAPPGDIETGELSRTEFSAVDWGKDAEKRYGGNNEEKQVWL